MSAMLLRRAPLQIVCKGQAKVNERGKVSTRPGPVSQKDARKQRKAEQELQQLQQQQASSASASTAAVQDPAPASPSSSSSSFTEPAQASTSAPVQTQQQAGPSVTPQVVVDRIFMRMVAFAGLPVAAGIVLLIGIYFLKKQGGDDFPMWPAYVSQALAFGGGLLGITYGALSASWDPTREGSLLGWTEFRANLPLFLSRGKTN